MKKQDTEPTFKLEAQIKAKNLQLSSLNTTDSKLDKALINLFSLLKKECLSSPQVTAYILVDIIETKLNALKALEYHYRDNSESGQDKNKYPAQLKQAHTLLKEYSENWDKKDIYSHLILKEKHDPSGTVSHRNKQKKRP